MEGRLEVGQDGGHDGRVVKMQEEGLRQRACWDRRLI